MTSRLARMGMNREAFEWRELLRRLSQMGISHPQAAPRVALEVLRDIRVDRVYEKALGIA